VNKAVCNFKKPIYRSEEKKKLFAGLGSVRVVKDHDLGLKNAALGLRPSLGENFQDLGHCFSLYGPNSQQNNSLWLGLV